MNYSPLWKIYAFVHFLLQIQHKQKGKLETEGEEEELTHYGQSLADIEKFDDIGADSDSDEDGRLGGKSDFDIYCIGFMDFFKTRDSQTQVSLSKILMQTK